VRRPLVGVTASRKGGRAMWWFNRYALLRAGGRAVRIASDREFPIERLDAVVIGGGDDIEPVLYGERQSPAVRVDPERDAMELRILDWTTRLGIPVLGICRGSQMINIHRGGTLHTDIYEVYEKAPRMRTILPRKTVTVDADSRLRIILERDACRVNALHHQSIAKPGDGVRCVARDEAGIVQAIEVAGPPFLIGVQWHPEFLVRDRRQQNLFRCLVEAARHCRVRRAQGRDCLVSPEAA
jgi:putative glutamine amidotransferase